MAEHKGQRASTPKHGKNPDNRLWSKYRRGDGDGQPKAKNDGQINPDGAIEVAAVCGPEVRIYDRIKHGRLFVRRYVFNHLGAAQDYAHEFESIQRRRIGAH